MFTKMCPPIPSTVKKYNSFRLQKKDITSETENILQIIMKNVKKKKNSSAQNMKTLH